MRLLDLYKPIRRISYPLTAVGMVVIVSYYLVVKNFSLVGVLLTTGLAVFFVLLWLKLRPGPSEVTDAAQVRNTIGNGRPTFLNIYSDY